MAPKKGIDKIVYAPKHNKSWILRVKKHFDYF